MMLEAKESAELIIKEAQNFAESLLEKQKQLGINDANAKGSLLLKKTAGEIGIERLRKIANAKITSDWIVLSKKQQIISEVINEVENRLREMVKKQQYASILEKLIIEAGILLGGKELEVLLNEKDSRLPLNLAEIAKKVSAKTQTKANLSLLKETIPAIGGAIVRTKDGRTLMDNTFDDILRQREKIIAAKTSEILFQQIL